MDEKTYSYETQTYAKSLTARALQTGTEDGRFWVRLEDTILFPEGGGQPADRGWFNGVPVVDVQWVNNEIHHYLPERLALDNSTVELELDWERRFDHMQQHSAQHLISAVAAERFGWKTTAFHLGGQRCDIEFDADAASSRTLQQLEEAVAEQIRAGLPITTRRVSGQTFAGLDVRTRGLPSGHTGSVRLVEIEGLDRNNCGGTHLRSTSEIETVKVLGVEAVRRRIRLYYLAGARVRSRFQEHLDRNAQLRDLLATHDENLVDAVDQKLQQLKEALRRQKELEQKLAEEVAGAMAGEAADVISRHFEGEGMAFLQQVARHLVRQAPEKLVLLTAGDEKSEGVFVLAAGRAKQDLSELGSTVARILEGRGGGTREIYQGKASRLGNVAQALPVLRSALDPSS